MKVLHLGEETLREVSKPVEKIDENIKNLIDEMFVTVKKENGIGLAAPQVGENIRLFIDRLSEEKKAEAIEKFEHKKALFSKKRIRLR